MVFTKSPSMTDNVGDINSDAKGSGARYNAGKPKMELIPVWIIAESEYEIMCFREELGEKIKEEKREAIQVLRALGDWQRKRGSLTNCFKAFGNRDMDLSYWKDCADVFDYGARKYATWNWAKGMAWSIPVACIVRHALAILRGEQNDPESGLPHRGHIMCNLVMLSQYEKTFPEGNDIPFNILSGEFDKKE